jgi:hypothetical protein
LTAGPERNHGGILLKSPSLDGHKSLYHLRKVRLALECSANLSVPIAVDWTPCTISDI